jgi:hypothetical protein
MKGALLPAIPPLRVDSWTCRDFPRDIRHYIFLGNGLQSGISHQNPIQRLIESTKHADSCFAIQFAMNLKHPGESERHVVSHHEGAAGIRRKDVSLGELAQFFRFNVDAYKLGAIQNLGKCWIKVRVFRQPFHVSPDIFLADDTSAATQHEPAFFIDFVKSRHARPVSMAAKADPSLRKLRTT